MPYHKVPPGLAQELIRSQFRSAGWSEEEIDRMVARMKEEDKLAALTEEEDPPPPLMWSSFSEQAILRELLGGGRRFDSSEDMDMMNRLCAQVVGDLMMRHLRLWQHIDLTPAVSLESIRLLKQLYDILIDPATTPEQKVADALTVYDSAGIL